MTVTDASGGTLTRPYTISPLAIVTASLPQGAVGTAYSHPVVAAGGSGNYTFSFSGALPAGLSLNSATGLMSGTPTSPAASVFSITVNDGSLTASKSFTVTPLGIVTATLPGGTVGTPYSQSIVATGGVVPYVYSVIPGTLPAGLALSPTTGTIGGTPTSSVTTPFTITVIDAAGLAVSRTYTISFLSITTATLPNGAVGVAYSQTLAAAGAPPFNWTITVGALPAGLTLTSGTGAITGTPTSPVSSTFTVQVTDAGSGTATRSFTVVPLGITTNSIGTASVGSVYSATVAAAGGTSPYTFSMASGTLPTGLSLSAAGVISGTPSVAGPATFTVRVTDSVGGASTKSFTLSPLGITTATLANGQVGVSYSQTVGAAGGTAPYTFTGTLPAGLSLNSATGAITGTPASSATANFTVTVTDSLSVSSAKSFTITPVAALEIATASLSNPGVGVVYSQTLATAGGTAPYTFTWTGTLPTGLTLSTAGVLSGNPSAVGSFTFNVQVTDNVGATATKSFTLSPLGITTATLANGQVGVVYSQTVVAAGGTAPYTFSGTLPAGLSLNPATGAITGTPASSATANFTVTVTDSLSVSSAKSFTITPVAALEIATVALPNPGVGVAYSQTLATAGGTAPYTFTPSGTLPTGLTLSTAGVLSGNPSAVGSFTFNVQVTDNVGATATKSFTLSPLGITTATLANGQVGVAYSQTVGAAGGTVPYTFSGTLPAGLTLNPATGAIAGTPASSATANFTVTVTDSLLISSAKSFTITPVAALEIATAALPNPGVGVAYSQTLATAGGTAPYTFTWTGTLPTGLTLSTAGVLSGNPSAVGSFPFTAQVTDNVGATATKSYTLSPLGITTAMLPNPGVDAPYSQTLLASGGTGPYTWSVHSGAPPPNVTLSSAGVLSGTALATGAVLFKVQVTDSLGVTATKEFTLSPLAIATPALPNPGVGVVYSKPLTPMGGTPPFQWLIAEGAPPPGLELTPDGVLTGVPQVPVPASFTAKVIDAVGGIATKPFALSPLGITTSKISNGQVGVAYSQTLATTGGTGPSYLFDVTGGALPTGVTLSPAGTLSGIPASATSATFTVRVTDSDSVTSLASFTVTPTAALSITTVSLPNPGVGTAYSQTLAATDGTPPYTWSVTVGAPPVGLTLGADGVLSGIATSTSPANFTVMVTDSVSGTATQPFTLTPIDLAPAALPNPVVGTAYLQTLTPSGGTPPFVFGVSSGLPTGLILSPAGVLSGTPQPRNGGASLLYGGTKSGQLLTINTATGVGTLVGPPPLATSTEIVFDSFSGRAWSQQGDGFFTIREFDIATAALIGGPIEDGYEYTGLEYVGPTLYGTEGNPSTLRTLNPTTGISAPVGPTGTGPITGLAYDKQADIMYGIGGGPGPSSLYKMNLSTGAATIVGNPLAQEFGSLEFGPDGNLYAGTSGSEVPASLYRIDTATGFATLVGTNIGFNQLTGLTLVPAFSGYTTEVTVTDATGGTRKRTYTISPLAIVAASLPHGAVGTAYSQPVGAAGGSGIYTFSVSSGVLPVGLTLNGATGVINGTPTSPAAATFTIAVFDGALTASKSFEVTPLGIVTATLPAGTVGTPYSQNIVATGGVAPRVYSLSSGTLPVGFTLGPATGTISGTPTSSVTSPFTITVIDDKGLAVSQTYTISFLSITTVTLPNGAVGVAYSQTLTAAGAPPFNWTIATGGLPAGLTLNSGTGAIAGTPTSPASSTFTVQVTDVGSGTATRSFTVFPLGITTNSIGTASVGTAYTANLAAAGGLPPYTYLIASGTLPTGLSLSAAGVISGTPSVAGPVTFTVQATDAASGVSAKSFFLSPLGIATSFLANGQVAVAYSQAIGAVGGAGPYTLVVTGGALPAGLTLSAAGVISGTPTSTAAATFTVTVTDTASVTNAKSFTITPVAALEIATATLPNPSVGVAYNQTLQTTGGTAPYAFTSSGTLPTGLALSTAGVLSGTPSATGSFTFSAQVTDNGGGITTKSYTLSPLSVTTASLPAGTVIVPYSQTLAATGGTAPYTWTGTQLPGGLTLSSDGVLSGTPAGDATFGSTIEVTDAAGVKASRTLSILIRAQLLIATTSPLPSATVGSAYSQTLTATGALQPYTWSASATGGFSVTAAGAVTGTPSSAGAFTLNVTVTDSTGVTATKALGIAANPPPLVIGTTSPLASATVGTVYSQSFQAAGGTPPYSWTSLTVPAGLTLSSGGSLSGTPALSGAVTMNVTVTDSANVSASGSFSITVNPAALEIATASPLAEGTIGSSYSQAFAANGGRGGNVWSVSAGALPGGLTLSPAGTLAGSPTASGTFTFTVQVADSGGTTASKQFQVKINALQLVITSTSPLVVATVGTAYSQTLTATGGTAPLSWSATGLPAGLTLSAGGALSGTPTAAGLANINVTVTDSAGVSAGKPLALTVNPAPISITTASPLPAGTAGAVYSAGFAATGGAPPYNWSVISGSLPVGLSISISGGLSGTPQTAGPFQFNLQVADSSGGTATKPFTLAINPAPVSITTQSPISSAVAGTPYSQTFGATGGTPGYTWALTAGSLPAGVTLSPAGVISGTPTVAGSFTFTLSATDTQSATATRQFTFPVSGAPLLIATATLPAGTAGSPYSQTMAATGGSAPYKWSVAGGSLPAGITLSEGGDLAGIPTAAGAFAITIRVTDSALVVTNQQFTITVASPALLNTTPSPLPDAGQNKAYLYTLRASGGTAPFTWALTNGALPAGLALNGATGDISGTPTAVGTFTFTAQVTDAAQATAGKSIELRVIAEAANELLVSESGLSFTVVAGGPAPPAQAISVIAGGTAPLPFQVTVEGPSFITVTPAAGTTPGRAQVVLSSTAQPPGTVTARLLVSSSQGTRQIAVPVTITIAAAPAKLEFSPEFLRFDSSNAQGLAAALSLRNVGGGTLPFTLQTTVPWLSAQPGSGSITASAATSILVSANPALAQPGTNSGAIQILTGTTTVSVPVTLIVSRTPSLGLSPSGIRFTARQGSGVSGGPQSFQIVNQGGDTALSFTADQVGGDEWLSLSPRSGSTGPGAPGTVTLTATPGALTPGSYYSLIRISAAGVSNSPQNFVAVLEIQEASTPPVPNPSPAGAVFVSLLDGAQALPQTAQVFTSSATPIPFQASATTSDGRNWLAVSPAGGTTSSANTAAITLSVNAAGLTQGVYTGGVNLSLNTTEVRTINVSLIVAPAPAAAGSAAASTAARRFAGGCTASKLVATHTGLTGNFSAAAGWPTPLVVKLADDCGNLVANGQVIATFSNGDPPQAMSLLDSKAALYSATWTPSKLSSQMSVAARFSAPGFTPSAADLSGSVRANKVPLLARNGTLHNTNPKTGAALAPGTVVQIFGSDLAALTTIPALPLPTEVNGTIVVIGGIEAPLFFVSAGQINAQIPTELVPGREYQIVVNANGALTSPDTIVLSPVQPGVVGFADGRIIAQHSDFSLITAANPARPGEPVVMYLLGMGLTDIPVATGALAPSSPLARLQVEPEVTVDGEAVEIFFAGLTPGGVGLYQINFRIPRDARTGDLNVIVKQGDVVSNAASVPVKPE